MAKRILSVGFDFPGGEAECIPFHSDQSLLDADLIVFEPRILRCYYSLRKHHGKPLLGQTESVEVIEDITHWQSELDIALDSGKTIILFLPKLEDFYFWSRKPCDNYSFLPVVLDQIVPKGGREIRVAQDLKFLSTYWKEFAEYSVYEVYFESEFEDAILTTKTGNKVVGAIKYIQEGTTILLPPIRYDIDAFTEYDEKEDVEVWTPEAIAFGKRLAACLAEIDDALRSGREATPPPEWAKSSTYRLEKESLLEEKIKEITEQIEDLDNTRSQLTLELEREGKLRRLLYEKGALLQETILDALHLMGFKAETYQEAESEFDVVFTSPEGRFLGEVEGKDNKAINIDKLSQLERNLQEDFTREEVEEYAKGVLFGNAYRLRLPSERSKFFTKKCTSGAKRSKVALVRTPDLFEVAKYLREHNAPAFAQKCREAIMQAEGEVVNFPKVPAKAVEAKEESKSL
jgi:hypothetical protein